ncbi:MAG: hypothetical protein PHY41_02510 [Candidatus Cloacimonetes bacterium]|jgi:hypothetical protein|nr:hypothetical protein [Candidatus Cloacimonadota bacterium]MDY0299654.1 hypothetical protein [Candidatus Cloacimonadaceae bacterium]MCB5278662.1 hypothetical protein [Candidatus Cloacimonadota bacterium]MCK9332675.1 hypothetical protein [Candidatus Cloacimonadota bacterium]MDD2211356.1 hypothetical protein [Candidatus Cloacimonadota bacterium]
MKIVYQSDKILASIKDVERKRPDLFVQLKLLIEKLNGFDYDDLMMEIDSQLKKSDRDPSKVIKKIPKFHVYEFRIPPHHRRGVLRIQFIIEEDRWTLCFTRVWIKPHSPKDKRKKK